MLFTMREALPLKPYCAFLSFHLQSVEATRTVHERLADQVVQNKESKDPKPLTVTVRDISGTPGPVQGGRENLIIYGGQYVRGRVTHLNISILLSQMLLTKSQNGAFCSNST